MEHFTGKTCLGKGHFMLCCKTWCMLSRKPARCVISCNGSYHLLVALLNNVIRLLVISAPTRLVHRPRGDYVQNGNLGQYGPVG